MCDRMEDVLKRFREGQRNFTVTPSRGSAVVIEDEIYIYLWSVKSIAAVLPILLLL